MELNLKHPLKNQEKNDRRVGVQVDRPALQITVKKTFQNKDLMQMTKWSKARTGHHNFQKKKKNLPVWDMHILI